MLWFERFPERLEFELRELQQFGFAYEIDADRRTAGEIVLTVKYRIDDVEHPLRVVFPSQYPYFPFQVYAPTLDLPRHQDPYSRILCFVARIDSEWEPTDTVARFLRDRLPLVLQANKGDPSVVEAQEGAPATGYMNFMPGTLVVTSEWSLPLEATRGSLVIGYERGTDPNVLLRGSILEIRDSQGRPLGEASPALRNRAQGQFEGRWVRLSRRPRSTAPEEVLAEAVALWPALNNPMIRGGPDVVGTVFQDEARFGEKNDLWTFIVRRRDREVALRGKGKRLPPGDKFTCYLARSDRGGREDLEARVPRLKALAEKKVAVFGLGALGSTVAIQLARAGIGRLHLIDHDYVQAGNIPRWALGWSVAGFPKVHALSAHIAENYPFVRPAPLELKVGAPVPLGLAPGEDEKFVDSAVDDADLVIDCTVEFTTHHYLSDVAWARDIPYVWMSATTGGWGGRVGRAHRGKTAGCWKCFERYQYEGRYRSPAAESVPDVQPVGCFSPTFTGTGFDLDAVALTGVRLATGTLCVGVADGYPDFDWDVGVLDLWNEGRPIAGTWYTWPLDRHPECNAHG